MEVAVYLLEKANAWDVKEQFSPEPQEGCTGSRCSEGDGIPL